MRTQPHRSMTVVASQPRRGVTLVASHSYGWYKGMVEKHAFRYATASNLYRVPTARSLTPTLSPAIGMAGYQYLMPLASAVTCHRRLHLSNAYSIGYAELTNLEK